MEGLTRLVSESLARHGYDRPLDYRRLHWSRWFRCESPHSLLHVPSKPGVFALAEEIMELGAADALVPPAEQSETMVEERRFSAASSAPRTSTAALATEGNRRMLAVAQFFEDEDMAFVLDRMLSRQNPMRVRLLSGHYFVRFVVIEDQAQRRSICAALNQWISNTTTSGFGETFSAIGAHFATSLGLSNAHVGTAVPGCPAERSSAASSGAIETNFPAPFPSGF